MPPDRAAGERAPLPADRPGPVPWRTILATVAVAAGAYASFLLVRELTRVLTWLVVAGFFTLVLAPAVDLAQRHLRLRRGLATALVFFVGLGLLGGMLYTFIRPVVDQVDEFVDDLPRLVEDARQGRGAIGELVARYDLDRLVEENQDRLQ